MPADQTKWETGFPAFKLVQPAILQPARRRLRSHEIETLVDSSLSRCFRELRDHLVVVMPQEIVHALL
jgi:hypothetical protein